MKHKWDVTGHQKQIDYLSAMVKQNALAHAFLFVGPRSIGKGLVARMLAKSILCGSRTSDGSYCGNCKSCIQFAGDGHPDFFLISGDGNDPIKIEQIKEMQHFLLLRPYSTAHKICLIQDADFMTVSAQNALLKILEEPPEYAVLILVAKSQDSILSTIASRCREINFGLVASEEVNNSLQNKGIDADTISLLSAIYPGRIGIMRQIAQDESAMDRLKSQVRAVSELSGMSPSSKLEQLNSLKIDSLEAMLSYIHLLYCLWDLGLRAKSDGSLSGPDLGSWLGKIPEIPKSAIVEYLSRIQKLEIRAKAGINYQLQLENLVLQMPN